MNLPADFKKFWGDTLQLASNIPLEAELQVLNSPSPEVELYDLRFKGLNGVSLAAFYMLPRNRPARIPAVLQFHGYLSCKSEPSAHLPWLRLGMAVLAVDLRGQAGDSKGGGLALATACLNPEVALCAADNPSLIDFPGRLELGAMGSADEQRIYLKQRPEMAARAMETLRYFDLLNHLPSLHCPSFWSASDNDPICPLPTIRDGFDLAPGKDKQLKIYNSMGHDVHSDQLPAKLEWVRMKFSI